MNEEVTRVFAFPLARAARGELDGTIKWPIMRNRAHATFACWNFDGETVWGLTYDILERLLKIGAPPHATTTTAT